MNRIDTRGISSLTSSSLANDICQWITESGRRSPAPKLNLLCSPVFQGLAGNHFDDHFIKNFRVLIWTTMLLNSATVKPDQRAHIQAEKNLKRLINFCGQAVISKVDTLCKHKTMKSQSLEKRYLLFIVLIGLCLSASYIRVS